MCFFTSTWRSSPRKHEEHSDVPQALPWLGHGAQRFLVNEATVTVTAMACS